MVSTLLGTLLFSTACSGSTSSTDDAPTDDPTALATELINQYGKAIFERDQETLGEMLSDAFLLRRTDGTGYTREGFIDALAEGSDYELVGYKVTDVNAQQDGDILVTTFTEDVDVIENGKSVTSEPSPALVTFVRVDGQWKVASEAFFSK
jgi:hypothetical protein